MKKPKLDNRARQVLATQVRNALRDEEQQNDFHSLPLYQKRMRVSETFFKTDSDVAKENGEYVDDFFAPVAPEEMTAVKIKAPSKKAGRLDAEVKAYVEKPKFKPFEDLSFQGGGGELSKETNTRQRSGKAVGLPSRKEMMEMDPTGYRTNPNFIPLNMDKARWDPIRCVFLKPGEKPVAGDVEPEEAEREGEGRQRRGVKRGRREGVQPNKRRRVEEKTPQHIVFEEE